jgi:hypothetical protein
MQLMFLTSHSHRGLQVPLKFVAAFPGTPSYLKIHRLRFSELAKKDLREKKKAAEDLLVSAALIAIA